MAAAAPTIGHNNNRQVSSKKVQQYAVYFLLIIAFFTRYQITFVIFWYCNSKSNSNIAYSSGSRVNCYFSCLYHYYCLLTISRAYSCLVVVFVPGVHQYLVILILIDS